MLMEYIVPSLNIVAITEMIDVSAVKEILLQLLQLEEERFAVGYHQNVYKEQHKEWHERHIKNKNFLFG